MSPEEFQRIKEAEKAHLRKLRELKQAVRTLRRQQSVNEALDDMATGAGDALDTHREMVDRLALETAQAEARMDIALEATREKEQAPEPPSPEALDEELQQARAQELIRRLKGEMANEQHGGTADERTASDTEAAESDADASEAERPFSSPTKPLPEKTLGRMR